MPSDSAARPTRPRSASSVLRIRSFSVSRRLPSPAADAAEVEVGRDGLILEVRGSSGLLVPQVATEWGFDRDRFLEEVARKAGLPRDAWRDPAAKIWRFQADVFAEGGEDRET